VVANPENTECWHNRSVNHVVRRLGTLCGEGCYSFVTMLALNHHSGPLLKGLVHPKMKILSAFTHPHVFPNLFVFICSAEHKGRYLEECFNQTDLIPH